MARLDRCIIYRTLGLLDVFLKKQEGKLDGSYENAFEWLRGNGSEISVYDEYFISIKAAVGGALMVFRKANDLSQEEMAEYFGIDLDIYKAMEDGGYNFKLSEIAEICEKIGYSPELRLEQRYFPEVLKIKDVNGIKFIIIKIDLSTEDVTETIELLLKGKYKGSVIIDQSKHTRMDPEFSYLWAYFDGEKLKDFAIAQKRYIEKNILPYVKGH